MKIKKNLKNENYLILKEGEKILILADKNIKSVIIIQNKNGKLLISSEINQK